MGRMDRDSCFSTAAAMASRVRRLTSQKLSAHMLTSSWGCRERRGAQRPKEGSDLLCAEGGVPYLKVLDRYLIQNVIREKLFPKQSGSIYYNLWCIFDRPHISSGRCMPTASSPQVWPLVGSGRNSSYLCFAKLPCLMSLIEELCPTKGCSCRH